MSARGFSQGVRPGGLFDKDNIKIIICYMLFNIDTGLTEDNIITVLAKNEFANYFETVNALDELKQQKHIFCCDEEKKLFTITDTGRTISEQLSTYLPIALRDRVLNKTIALMAQIKRESENFVDIVQIDKGYMVNCTVSGTNVDLLQLNIYAPDIMQAQMIRENFLKKPQAFYSAVLELLSF